MNYKALLNRKVFNEMITFPFKSFNAYLSFTATLMQEYEHGKQLHGKEKTAHKKKIRSRWSETVCPKCNAKGQLSVFDSYDRDIIFFSYPDLKLISHLITVPRLKCKSCGSTHAILPIQIIPYCQYLVDTVLIGTYLYKYMDPGFYGRYIFLPATSDPSPFKSNPAGFFPPSSLNNIHTSSLLDVEVAFSPKNEAVVAIDFAGSSMETEVGLYETFTTSSGIDVLTPLQGAEKVVVPHGFGGLEQKENLISPELQIQVFDIHTGVTGKSVLVPKDMMSDRGEFLLPGSIGGSIPPLFCGYSRLSGMNPLISPVVPQSLEPALQMLPSPILLGQTPFWGDVLTVLTAPSLYGALEGFLTRKGNVLKAMGNFATKFIMGDFLPRYSPDMRDWFCNIGDCIVFKPLLKKRGYSFEEQIGSTCFGIPSTELYNLAKKLETRWVSYAEDVLRSLDVWKRSVCLKAKEAVELILATDLTKFQEKMFERHSVPFMFPFEKRDFTGLPFTGYIPCGQLAYVTRKI